MGRATLAAIDVGTNSFHMVIAEADPAHGTFRVIGRDREYVRLGAGSTDMKHLSAGAMNRGVETLKRFKKLADAAKAPVRAVATSAVREALNRDEFIAMVRAETGLKIEVVSGAEEARLVYEGVLAALPVHGRTILLVDVGGGSTEFLIGLKGRVKYDHSLKLGAIRLTDRFFPGGAATPGAVAACRGFVTGMLSPIAREMEGFRWQATVGTSGTMLTLAAVIRAARGEPADGRLNAFRFSRAELQAAVDRIVSARTGATRARIPGVEPARADLIAAGALIAEGVAAELGIRELTVSEYALREGIVIDTLRTRRDAAAGAVQDDLRLRSVARLAALYHAERPHAQHVAALALRIFD